MGQFTTDLKDNGRVGSDISRSGSTQVNAITSRCDSVFALIAEPPSSDGLRVVAGTVLDQGLDLDAPPSEAG